MDEISPDMRRKMAEANAALSHAIAEAIVPPDLKAAGWEYRDLPLLGGKENYKIVVMSSRANGDKRGQFIISPDGMRRLREHVANGGAPTNAS